MIAPYDTLEEIELEQALKDIALSNIEEGLNKRRGIGPTEYGILQSDSAAPEGLIRECPMCSVVSNHDVLKKATRGSKATVFCPVCDHEFEIVKGVR